MRLLLPKDVRTVRKNLQAYFKDREEQKKSKTFYGLCKRIGIDYDLFTEIGNMKTYEDLEKLSAEHNIKKDVLKSLKDAYLEIMDDYEMALRAGGGKSTGAVFTMKVQGWKTEDEHKERDVVINLINYDTGKTKQIKKADIIQKKPKRIRSPKRSNLTEKTI